MKYIIIGLNDYGSVLAEELSAMGHEVIGADIDADRAERLKDKIAATFVIDATDEQALSVLPLNTVDVVIVSVGKNLGVSVRAVALLKRKKVKRIYARSIDETHHAILEAFGLERILTPEVDAARALVRTSEFGPDMETFRIDAEHHVVKFTVPARLVGYYVGELKLGSEFGLQLLALNRGEARKNALDITFSERKVFEGPLDKEKIQEGDQLVCYGRYHDFLKFRKALK